jgi:hypothetical protein
MKPLLAMSSIVSWRLRAMKQAECALAVAIAVLTPGPPMTSLRRERFVLCGWAASAGGAAIRE